MNKRNQKIGSFVIPETNDFFPIVELKCGERAIIKIRAIPATEMVEVTTLPDHCDQGRSKVLRIPASTKVTGVSYPRRGQA